MENQIDISIIQPLPGAPDSDRVHSEIYKLTKNIPRKFMDLLVIIQEIRILLKSKNL